MNVWKPVYCTCGKPTVKDFDGTPLCSGCMKNELFCRESCYTELVQVDEGTPYRHSTEHTRPVIDDVYRVHQLTRYFYCDEENRLRQMEHRKPAKPFTEAMTMGTDVHEWLEKRPRGKAERIVEDKLVVWRDEHKFTDAKGKEWKDLWRPLTYQGKEVRIVAHPDNIRTLSMKQLDGSRDILTQIEEQKTVERLDKLPDGSYGYNWFKRSQAEFQAQLYRWVLGYILPQVD